MEDADRFRLLGRYRTPRFRPGRLVRCEVLGEVIICRLSDAPIPWPVCRRGKWLVPWSTRDWPELSAASRPRPWVIGGEWGTGSCGSGDRHSGCLAAQRAIPDCGVNTPRSRGGPQLRPRHARRQVIRHAGPKLRLPRQANLGRLMSEKLCELPTWGRSTRPRPVRRCRRPTRSGAPWSLGLASGPRPRMTWCGRCPLQRQQGAQAARGSPSLIGGGSSGCPMADGTTLADCPSQCPLAIETDAHQGV